VRVNYRAAWVLPIARPPIAGGWVAVENRVISRVGSAGDEMPMADDTVDIGPAAILPGLVNAHTHLELSWMRGQVPPGGSMPAWAARLMARRRTVGEDPVGPIADAVLDAHAAGTAVVGDVTNTLASYELLADSQLAAAIFRELLGFNAADPAQVVAGARAQIDALTPLRWLRPSIVPHAPYSVSPDLFRAIAAASEGGPMSVHVAESAEEVQFLRDGTGAWRDMLGALGVWNERWSPPGSSPVQYLHCLGLVSSLLIAVHCVHVDDHDLERLASAGATVATCPRSNRWTGAGVPPIERFYASGVRVALGTDSLASVDDLNLFAEMAAVRQLAPAVPAARILESATRIGAEALGFGGQFGTLEPGRCADLIAVRVPAGVTDVEEYLVSGITPDAVRWLST
jgi:cytosine/adenosine deaminase-related metal-dependent hydrolase